MAFHNALADRLIPVKLSISIVVSSMITARSLSTIADRRPGGPAGSLSFPFPLRAGDGRAGAPLSLRGPATSASAPAQSAFRFVRDIRGSPRGPLGSEALPAVGRPAGAARSWRGRE